MWRKLVLFFILLSCIKVQGQSPTWSGDIAKMIYGNCTSCHRTGGITPFALETYEEVSNMAGWVQQAIENKTMPPWTPDKEYKHFAHERVLEPSDVATFQQWVAAGTPSGNLHFAPPVPVFSTGSQLGTPDISLAIPTYTVTTTSDLYRNFELFPGNANATYATAIEVIPGNSSIVHHVLVFQDSTSNPINADGGGGTGSNASELIYGFVPGSRPYYTPVGTGIRLATNTRLIVQVHYAPGSNGQSDSTIVNIKTTSAVLRKITIKTVLNPTNMTNGPLLIPPNEVKTFDAVYTISDSITAFCTFTHMHLLGQHVKVWANDPVTNDTSRIVWIPKWDFHWQDNYIFPNSMILPSGTSIKAQVLYDNTTSNPNNPSSPPVTVAEGVSTTDEMFLIFLAYVPYQSGDENLIIDKRVFPKGATTFCEGQSVRLETIQGIGYSYQWYLDGVAIDGSTNYYYEAFAAGNYTVSIQLGGNNALSDPISISVSPAPAAQIQTPSSTTISQGGTITLSAVQSSGVQYQWYLNGNAISGAVNASYDASSSGVYVLETYNGSCFSLSDTLVLTGGLAELSQQEMRVEIVPNPASDVIHLDQDLVASSSRITITDTQGKLVQMPLFDSKSSSMIDLSGIPAGVYFLTIYKNDDETLYRKRFVLSH